MRTLRYGTDALLVELADTAAAMRVYDEARRREVVATDVVPAARTVLFSGVPDVSRLAEELAGWESTAWAQQRERAGGDDPADAVTAAAGAPLVEVPTVYDGEDLGAVARHWDVTTREVVERHTSVELVVAFCGFSPGFAYCIGPRLGPPVPRLEEPRTRVPAGSVGLAGSFTGVYPSASPGGWQLVGHTDLTLWDHTREPPATLTPGTRVRFVEVTP